MKSTQKNWKKLLGIAAVVCAVVTQGHVLPRAHVAHAATSNDVTVYWLNGGTSTVKSMKGDGTNKATVPTVSTGDRAITSDGTSLYYANGNAIYRAAFDGTGVTKLADTVNAPGGLFVTTTKVYYSEWSGGVFSIPIAGGSPTQLITSAEKNAVQGPATSDGFTGVFASASYLYFATYGAGGGTHSSVFRSDLTGTTASVALLYSDGAAGGTSLINTNDIWVTATNIYIADSAGSNGMMTLNLDGSSPSARFKVGTTMRAFEIAGDYMYYSTGTSNIGKFPIANTSAASTTLATSTDVNTAWDIAIADNPTYTVTYSAGLANGGNAPVDPNVSYAPNSSVTILGNTGSLTRNGYEFNGWQLDQSGSTTYPSIGQSFTITGNAVLTARWMGGPLEFSTTPSGAAASTIAFPGGVFGTPVDITIYMRNAGLAARQISNVGLQTGLGLSRTGGTCSTGGSPDVLPYASGSSPDHTCTHIFRWNPTSTTQTFSTTFDVNSGALSASVTLTGLVLAAPRVPTFDTPVPTADGYTVNVTNWNASWAWNPTVSSGTVTAGTAVGSTLPLTVTGIGYSTNAVVTVATVRANYQGGTATVGATSAVAPTTTTTTTVAIAVAPTTTTSSTVPSASAATSTTSVPVAPSSTTTTAVPRSTSAPLPHTGGGELPRELGVLLLLAGMALLGSVRIRRRMV